MREAIAVLAKMTEHPGYQYLPVASNWSTLIRGTVRPPIFKINVANMPTIRYGWPHFNNLTADFAISVRDSQIEVRCDVSRFDTDGHLLMLAMHAYELSMAAIDCFCFSSGLGLRVFLETFVDADGKQTALTPRSEEAVGLCTAFNLAPSYKGPDNYKAMFSMVVKERALLLALNYLIVPVSHFNLATINYARAIEALRAAMAQPEWTRDEEWEFMRRQLNLTKPYLKLVIDLSAEPRHGRRKAPEEGQQAEITKRAWVIMNRFLEYRKRGNQQLPIADFELI